MTVIKTSDADAVREMYDLSAESYAEMMDSEMEDPMYADMLGRLRTNIADLSGPIVDAPCGSGHLLSMYHENFDADRPLLGIDLSPQMVAISKQRLGDAANISVADLRKLTALESSSAAAVVSYFAFHHLDSSEIIDALAEWHRILQIGGQLVVATWEGEGAIDYGEHSDLVALRHRASDIESMITDAGFSIARSAIERDEEMSMDAVYIECQKG